MKCSFDECEADFEPHRHNQKYCSPECCKNATNKRIRKKYYDTKQRLSGQHRVCSSAGCETILSRYTDGDICGKCISEIMSQETKILRGMFGVK